MVFINSVFAILLVLSPLLLIVGIHVIPPYIMETRKQKRDQARLEAWNRRIEERARAAMEYDVPRPDGEHWPDSWKKKYM